MPLFFEALTILNLLFILATGVAHYMLERDAEKVLLYIKSTERDLLHTIQELNGELHVLRQQVEIAAAPKTKTKTKTNRNTNAS